MNCLSHVRADGSALFRTSGIFIATTSLNQCRFPLWKINFRNAGVKTVDLELLLTRFHTRCYSSRSRTKTSRTKKVDHEQPVMENEKDAFFVVRKGDVVGVFKSFAECQAQIGSSICDPPVSVYKGSSLTKETGKYMSPGGLTNALYTIKAADVKEDLFGALTLFKNRLLLRVKHLITMQPKRDHRICFSPSMGYWDHLVCQL